MGHDRIVNYIRRRCRCVLDLEIVLSRGVRRQYVSESGEPLGGLLSLHFSFVVILDSG